MFGGNQTFRIFISSTFSDFKAERQALQTSVFARLRQLCQEHGARFQPIDLRWGISEEAAHENQTMKICLGEIKRCQKITPQPNFIVLLGNRYGWRPLPAEIPADEFEMTLSVVRPRERALLEAWYCRDSNSVLEVYRLLTPKKAGENDQDWKRVEGDLRRTLREASTKLPLSAAQRLKYVASATEQEIAQGVFNQQEGSERVFCFIRDIAGLPKDGRAANYVDLNDEGELDQDAFNRLEDLKKTLRYRLPGKIHEYQAVWTGGGVGTEHFAQLRDDVYECLSNAILGEVEKANALTPLDLEISAHAAFANERRKFFVGRADVLESLKGYFREPGRRPLAIFGDAGSGKSTILARATLLAESTCPGVRVVYRFIGTTPESSDGRTLLEGVCRQISRAYDLNELNLGSDYDELVRQMPRILACATAERPLCLFLDAVDQLSDTNNTRSLNWLPTEIPEHVRLVVSTLPGKCLSVLEQKLPPPSLLHVTGLSQTEGQELLDLWLRDADRKLGPIQWSEIMCGFARCPLPLYLKLAFEIARLWKSTDAAPQLKPDVPGLISDMLRRLSAEENHGQTLVGRSLAYLAAAKNGLTEDELLDLLYRDGDVMGDFRRRSPQSPPVNALPVVVWSRLFFDLEAYLTARIADLTSTLAFFHRELAEAITTQWLAGEAGEARHRHLAHYFRDQPLTSEGDNANTPNLRKLSELAYHQTLGQMCDDLKATLTSFDFINAKISSMGVQRLLDDYTLALAPGILPSGELVAACNYIEAAIRRGRDILASDPSQLAAQLLGRLCSCENPDVQSLLSQTSQGQTRPWLRPLRAGLTSPEQGLLGSVEAVAMTADGRRLVSGAADGTLKIWDLERGLELRTIMAEKSETLTITAGSKILMKEQTGGGIAAVAISRNMRWVISAVSSSSFATRIYVRDLETGYLEQTIYAEVPSFAVTPNSRWLLAPSSNRTLGVWSLETGQKERSLSQRKNALGKRLHTDYDKLSAVAVSPDGYHAIGGAKDGSMDLWNLESGSRRSLRGHRKIRLEWLYALIMAAGIAGVTTVLLFNFGGRLGLFNRQQYNYSWVAVIVLLLIAAAAFVLHFVLENRMGILDLAITDDGQIAVSASEDCTLKVWEVKTGKRKGILKGHQSRVTAVAAIPGSRRVISASFDGTLKLWDLESCRELLSFIGHKGVNDVAVVADGRHAISGARDGTVRIWDLQARRQVRTLEVSGSDAALTAGGRLNEVVVTPDRHFAVTSGLVVWDLATATKKCSLLSDKGQWPFAFALCSGGGRLISGTREGILQLWDLETGREVRKIRTRRLGGLHIFKLLPDQRRVICGFDEGVLELWNLETSAKECSLKTEEKFTTALTVSPDGQRVIAGSHQMIKVWDLKNRKLLQTLLGHTDSVGMVLVFRDGTRAISVSNDGTLRVWDLAAGREIHTLRKRSASAFPNGLAQAFAEGRGSGFRPVVLCGDDRRAVSADEDGFTVWDLDTGDPLRVVAGHGARVNAVALFDDQIHVVSASDDRTLKVWELESGKLVVTFVGESPFGHALATAGKVVIAEDDARSVHILRLEGI